MIALSCLAGSKCVYWTGNRICIKGIHPTWKTWNLEFCHFLSQEWKMPGIWSKSGINLEFKPKPRRKIEICKFYVSSFTFQGVIYKNNSDLLLCHIYIINTNTDSKSNWPWISLILPGHNLENTRNFVSQEKWEPWIYFNTFQDFYN